MTPSLTLYDPGNLDIADSVFFSESTHTYFSRFVEKSDLFNFRFSKLCHAMLFSDGAKSITHRIQSVLSGRSNIKMVWPDTEFYIALMANNFSGWYRSIMKRPGNSMRFLPSRMMSWVKFSIPTLCHGPHPEPTRICFRDVSPESFFRWSAVIVTFSFARKDFHFEPPVQDKVAVDSSITDDSL